MVEIPIREAEARGREWGRRMADVAGNLDLLLGLGVPPDIALEMGLDLWLMEIMPGVGALLRTQGNLEQLRRHIPVQPRGQFTAGLELRQHMSTLLQACPSFPAHRTPDQEMVMEQDPLLAEMEAAWEQVRAEGQAKGRAKERRLMLLEQAAPHLTEAVLSRCTAALEQMDLAALEDLPSVAFVRDVHVWSLAPDCNVLTTHILVDPELQTEELKLMRGADRCRSSQKGATTCATSLCNWNSRRTGASTRCLISTTSID